MIETTVRWPHFQCPKCGHEWEAEPCGSQFTRVDCPACHLGLHATWESVVTLRGWGEAEGHPCLVCGSGAWPEEKFCAAHRGEYHQFRSINMVLRRQRVEHLSEEERVWYSEASWAARKRIAAEGDADG